MSRDEQSYLSVTSWVATVTSSLEDSRVPREIFLPGGCGVLNLQISCDSVYFMYVGVLKRVSRINFILSKQHSGKLVFSCCSRHLVRSIHFLFPGARADLFSCFLYILLLAVSIFEAVYYVSGCSYEWGFDFRSVINSVASNRVPCFENADMYLWLRNYRSFHIKLACA